MTVSLLGMVSVNLGVLVVRDLAMGWGVVN